jgi:hypothetical protein
MKIVSPSSAKKYWKVLISPAAIFLFAACASVSQPQVKKAPPDPALIEKNKQIALKNEVTLVTQAVQKLEQQGRDMEAIRQAPDAESRRQCGVAMEYRQQQIKELETKVSGFPNPFNATLTPIIADLNVCVSCARTALPNCKKTRAALNEAIGEIFSK